MRLSDVDRNLIWFSANIIISKPDPFFKFLHALIEDYAQGLPAQESQPAAATVSVVATAA